MSSPTLELTTVSSVLRFYAPYFSPGMKMKVARLAHLPIDLLICRIEKLVDYHNIQKSEAQFDAFNSFATRLIEVGEIQQHVENQTGVLMVAEKVTRYVSAGFL